MTEAWTSIGEELTLLPFEAKLHGMDRARQQPNHETPLSPEQQLECVKRFLNTTNRLLLDQVINVENMKPFSHENTIEAIEEEVENTTQTNVMLASIALQELRMQSPNALRVRHPITGQLGIFSGIGFSTETMSYAALVQLPGQSGMQQSQTWPIKNVAQLFLD
jgi:hypothetical protein